MKPQLYASTFERLRGESTWRLLSASTAPEVLALMQYLLYDTDRTLPASVLTERLTTELEILRANGRDLAGTATYYLRDWLREGWLERRYLDGAADEEYELSAAAIQGLRIVESLQTQRTVATESRLSIVMDQLASLKLQTDADPITRLELLYDDRRRIDAEIDRVASGDVEVLDTERAVERLREIVALSRDLTEDFRRVRDQFYDLNRNFLERIVEDEAQRGQVLSDLFAGVDVIAESQAGRTFAAFWALLTDPEQSAQLEASLDAVASRDFTKALPREERQFLASLTRTLLDRAGHVNDTQTGFARSLRTFVQSREYQEQRRLSSLLQAAKASALPVRGVLRPEQQTGLLLQLSSATYRSVGQWKLHEPVQPIVAGPLEADDAPDIRLEDVQAAVEQSEIDFRALRALLRDVLESHSQVTVGRMLELHPAAQGLGTVVGYLAIGAKHGEIAPAGRERVEWVSGRGHRRAAHIPLIYFLAERREELHG